MKKNTMDFTTGPIAKKLFLFALPIIFSTCLQDLYNAADKIVVGQFAENGKLCLAAVGAVASANSLLIYLFSGLSLGINVICANLRGARKYNELRSAMHTALVLSVIAGIIVAVGGTLIANPMLTFLNTPDSIRGLAHKYMCIVMTGVPFMLLYNSGSGILLSNGDTKRPMIILSISGLVNVALNLLLVIVFGMGVEGVALGTVGSYIVSAVWVLTILFNPKDEYKMEPRYLGINKKDAVSLIKVAIPTGINNSVFGFSNILMQSAVNTLGDAFIAGGAAATSIINLIYLIPAGFYSATVSFTGQCYGARKFHRIDKVLKTNIIMAVSGIAILMSIFSLFPRQVLSVFNSDPEVVRGGFNKLMIMGWGYMIYCLQSAVAGCLHGIKKNTVTTVLNLFFVCGTRVPWVLWLFPLWPTDIMLYSCYPVSWVLCGAAQLTFFLIVRKKLWTSPEEELPVPAAENT